MTVLKSSKRHPGITGGVLTLAIAGAWFAASVAAADITPGLQQAILAEDWQSVANLAAAANTAHKSAIYRFLEGHACLALNRNNESVRLFRDTGNREETAQWDRWTKELANAHPASPVAAYLRGDAMARIGEHDQALSTFGEGLLMSPHHALILNARAVCYAGTHRCNEAIVDLDDAARANPRSADVHANRGTLNIRRSLGAPGAVAAFDRALDISPDFVLARIGRASALFGLGKWSDAQEQLAQCELDPDSGHLAVMNAAAMRDGASSAELAALTASAPGVAIDKAARLQQLKLESINQQIYKDDMSRIGHTLVADTFRDLGQLTKPFADTFKGVMEIARGNYPAGVTHLGGVGETFGRNEQTLAAMHSQLAQQGMQDWSKGISELQSLHNGGLQGGVATEDIRRGFLDKSDWRLLARFALQYPEATPGTNTTANLPAVN